MYEQRDRLQGRGYFEGTGLVFPVQVVTAAADACGGVFGPGVIRPRRLKAAVQLSKERLREIGRRAVKTRWARIRARRRRSGNKIER